jgi:transglutaminase-like putative cysteine protease
MEKTPTRWWDLPSAILLFLLVLFSAWRLQITDWTEQLALVRNIAVFGLILGLALGQSIYQKRGVTLLSLAYMIVLFIWQWLDFVKDVDEPMYLGDQFLILFGRLYTSFNEFFSGRAVEDQFLVIVLLFIPFWFVSLYSGYQLTRYSKVIASILPPAILMFIVHYNHYTTKDYSWMFGVYLFVALLFLGRQKYIADKVKWTKERVLFSNESSIDITNTSMTIAAAIVAIVWLIPYTLPATATGREAWQGISKNWFSGEFYENLFSSVNKEKKPQPKNFQTELALGTQTSQSDLVVFLAYAPPSAEKYPRLYWRGQVYDTFEDNQWLITGASEMRQPSSSSLTIPDAGNRERITFTFDVYTETQIMLFSASQPISVGQNTIVLYNETSPDSDIIDVMTLRASPALEAGDIIRISAMMANPTIPELQQTGINYPDWVTEKYLQLPDDFSPRIRDLALDIASQHDTPFDKATAITNYLRDEITYYSAIDVPDDVDPLEYFLFKKKQGFCNYSATVEVLMLRAVGIPARLAVGYAQGEANVQNSIYTVRERDLHAWPEVYFPEYGWIEFEPTGNQNPLSRPLDREETAGPITLNPIRQLPFEEEEQLPAIDEANIDEEQSNVFVTRSQILWVSIAGGFILLIGIAIVIKRKYAPDQSVAEILKNALEKGQWKIPVWLNDGLAWATLPPIERNFGVINTSLNLLKKPQPIHSTPIERANALKKILPHATSSIDILLSEYQAEMFSQTHGDKALTRRAAFWIIFYAMQAKLKTSIMGYN